MSMTNMSMPTMPLPMPPEQHTTALEQRIYDLLRPFRNEHFEVSSNREPTVSLIKLERKALVLSQNIAFLAHNHVSNTERSITPEDIFVVMRGWTGDSVAQTGGVIAVLVRYPNCTMGVVKAESKANVGVIDALCAKVDEMLAEAF